MAAMSAAFNRSIGAAGAPADCARGGGKAAVGHHARDGQAKKGSPPDRICDHESTFRYCSKKRCVPELEIS
jgi:hypothetical protein